MSQVKMAILGCGSMSGAHAKRYAANPDVQIVALCDVSEDVVQGYIDKHLAEVETKPQIFTDAAAMYAEARPDAVTIVTPHTMHFEHGMQAIGAGCHVLMEKPMVTASSQAHELARAVQASGKVFVIGYNSPCSPAFAYLREVIRSGELGALETVSGWQTQGWMRGTTGKWRQDASLSGGGQMYDSGAHLFNSLVWSVESPVETVFAFVDNCEAPVDINGAVAVRFQNGVLATIMISGDSRSDGSGMNFAFENGRVDIDGWNGKWIKAVRNKEAFEPELSGEYQTANDNFIDAILGRAEGRTGPVNGVIQSELMDAIYESARTGQAVRVQR